MCPVLSCHSAHIVMELFELTKTLVNIESVTGHEQACGEFLRHRLAQMGFQVDLQEVTPGRSNVLAFYGTPEVCSARIWIPCRRSFQLGRIRSSSTAGAPATRRALSRLRSWP